MTPNEQDAAIAREYAKKLTTEPWPTMSQFFRMEDCMAAREKHVSNVILEAASKIAVLRGREPV